MLHRLFLWPRGGLYYDSAKAYGKALQDRLNEHPNNRPLAFAQAIGAETLEYPL